MGEEIVLPELLTSQHTGLGAYVYKQTGIEFIRVQSIPRIKISKDHLASCIGHFEDD